MMIQVFSKDSKRGFAAGSNSLTPEKFAAGAVTLSSALIISAVGGLLKPKKSPRAGSAKKKKKPFWLLLAPLIYKSVKSAAKKNTLDGIAKKFSPPEPSDDLEIIGSIPISSEEEIYDHI